MLAHMLAALTIVYTHHRQIHDYIDPLAVLYKVACSSAWRASDTYWLNLIFAAMHRFTRK